MSLPARGVWVEIHVVCCRAGKVPGHSPHGECGLKSNVRRVAVDDVLVTPRTGSVG